MKLGLVIEESQGLQTHLNLRTDLTGSLVKIFSTTSCGRWFFLCRRLRGCGRGSLVRDIFSAEELFQENRVKSNLLCIALKHISFFFSFLFYWGTATLPILEIGIFTVQCLHQLLTLKK